MHILPSLPMLKGHLILLFCNKTSRLLVVLVLVLNGFELILTSHSRKTRLAIDSQCCLQPAGEVYCIKDINKMATSTFAFPFRLLTNN